LLVSPSHRGAYSQPQVGMIACMCATAADESKKH